VALTYNQLGNAMLEKLEELTDSDEVMNHDDWYLIDRDLAVARTALEDALTRYNSAQYRIRGTWERRDPDKG